MVAADVLVADEDGAYTPGGIRYYTMGIVKSDEGFGAEGSPLRSRPPRTLDAPDLVIAGLEPPSGDLEPIAGAVDGFLDALLAGKGDLERFVAPDTSLSPIDPAPFTDVEVMSIGARPEVDSPSRYFVRAQVAATDETDNTQILQYTIVMSQRAAALGGRRTCACFTNSNNQLKRSITCHYSNGPRDGSTTSSPSAESSSSLVAIFGVISTYWLTKALVPVLSALLVAGIAIWAVSPAGLSTLEGWIGNETAAPPVLEQPSIIDVDDTAVFVDVV